MEHLDLNFIRSQFPAFSQEALKGRVFAENAGGSYACVQTIEALTDYYTKTKLQPYGVSEPSQMAGAAMDRARQRWATFIQADIDEVSFGASTSANAYSLAHALTEYIKKDEEVIVCEVCHEANSGAMRRVAKQKNITLKEWTLNQNHHDLQIEDLLPLLHQKTAVICFTHCSNIFGMQYPVKDWIQKIRSICPDAIVVVDGVSNSPHAIPDVKALDCDIYMFSLYKCFSVHQGLLYVKKPLNMKLPCQNHFFLDQVSKSRLIPAGPDHAQVASANGVIDYFITLDQHHGGSGELSSLSHRINQRIESHEKLLSEILLETLNAIQTIQIIGPTQVTEGRHPNVSFHTQKDPKQIAESLNKKGMMTNSGHFYAWRLLKAMDIDPLRGIIRLSLVHYNTQDEVKTLCQALKEIL